MKHFKIYLYNSLRNYLEEFVPIDKDEVKIYSCGPTVYNYAHIGNMRAFLFGDLLQRVIRTVGGYKVKWVMNITDIDDKTIRDSKLGSEAWKQEMGEQSNDPIKNLRALTDYYLKEFKNDISDLGIRVEDFYALPRATEYISEMQKLILNIFNNGYAYISGGAVYFSVNKWRESHEYGRLKKIDFKNFREGVRIDADEYDRESVSDFVLWKSQKEGEPSWDFVLDGQNIPGRPGWHIECSSMEYEILGLPFDIHTGGVDLKFPHHEDEIAQSHAGYGIDPTNYWCHNEFLEVEGSKMSKSAGNFFTLRDLINKGLDPLDIRFCMLSSHYGSKYNFTFEGVAASHKARMRVQEFIWLLLSEELGSKSIDVESYREAAFTEFARDLHTPKALANVFDFVNNNNPIEFDRESKEKAIVYMKELNEIFAVWTFQPKKEDRIEVPQEIIKMAAERWEAKKQRDFARADELRGKITEAGYTIKDTKEDYKIFKS